MNKGILSEKIEEKFELSGNKSREVLNFILDEIKETLGKGESAEFAGFGTFSVVDRAARSGVNPSTGEKMQIPATKAVKFKPSKALKDIVKG